MAVRLLIIDDHPLVRDALRVALEAVSPGSRIDLASSFAEARRMLTANTGYDFMLLDLNLPDGSGFEPLKALRAQFPHVPTVMLSAERDRPTIRHCIELGACGYIPKTSHPEEITNALRRIAAGHIYLPPEAIDTRYGAEEPVRPRTVVYTNPRDLGLTDRHCDVLRHILRGLPNKMICRELNLAEGTVKVHVSAVLRALGVRNRTQAVIAAARLGLRMNE